MPRNIHFTFNILWFCIILILLSSFLSSCDNKKNQENNPDSDRITTSTIPEDLTTIKDETELELRRGIKDLIPDNTTLIIIEYGDLNKDGREDVVFVIETNEKENYIDNTDGLGPNILNINPRTIIIAFKTANGYEIKAKNKKLLPTENNPDNPCIADPLSEGGIKIEKGVLKIRYHLWSSCGSWSTSNEEFIYRYQKNKFKLIGYSSSSFHRASGEMYEISINYSTKKKCTLSGGNMFEGEEPTSEVWENIEINELYNFEDIRYDMVIPGVL